MKDESEVPFVIKLTMPQLGAVLSSLTLIKDHFESKKDFGHNLKARGIVSLVSTTRDHIEREAGIRENDVEPICLNWN